MLGSLSEPNWKSQPVEQPVAGPQTPAASGAGPVPPERPPKKPHLRASGISPEQEMRRIEASAHELMNLNQARHAQVACGPATKRKPPMPDPPSSPPKPDSAVSPPRSVTPDLPPPPPPVSVEDCVPDDPLPPPPPHVVIDDGASPSGAASPNSS